MKPMTPFQNPPNYVCAVHFSALFISCKNKLLYGCNSFTSWSLRLLVKVIRQTFNLLYHSEGNVLVISLNKPHQIKYHALYIWYLCYISSTASRFLLARSLPFRRTIIDLRSYNYSSPSPLSLIKLFLFGVNESIEIWEPNL